jgi:hypothetical protein
MIKFVSLTSKGMFSCEERHEFASNGFNGMRTVILCRGAIVGVGGDILHVFARRRDTQILNDCRG